MPSSVFGLPTHILVVHATVVLVPLAVLAVLASVGSGRLRARLGLATPGLAVLALVLVPITTSSGESLQARVPDSALVRHHVALADGLLPFVGVLAAAAVALHVLHRRARRSGGREGGPARASAGSVAPVGTRASGAIAATVLVGVLAVAAGVGSLVQVVRIGHSGSTAAWHGLPAERAR